MRRRERKRAMTSSLVLVALAFLHPETVSWAGRRQRGTRRRKTSVKRRERLVVGGRLLGLL